MAKCFKVVTEKNSWEHRTFYIGEKQITKGEFDGEILTIKWPNGIIEDVEVVFFEETRQAYDHGHTYDVSSDVPYFYKDINGVKSKFLLTKVKILLNV